MIHTTQPYRLSVHDMCLPKEYVTEILQMGLPAGIQSVIVSLSNVIVQYHINTMGPDVVAGFGVFNKVDGIIMLPGSSFALAIMTFVGQNYGAGKYNRIKDGIKSMCILITFGWMIGALICIFFATPISYLFTDKAEIVYYTKLTMKYLIPAYFTMNIGYGFTCVIRALNKSREASIAHISCMCLARQIWILIANALGFGLNGILLSYPISWIITIAVTGPYILYLLRVKQKVPATIQHIA